MSSKQLKYYHSKKEEINAKNKIGMVIIKGVASVAVIAQQKTT